MQKNDSLSPTSPDIYPKYRVVRKYDHYVVEKQPSSGGAWEPFKRTDYSYGFVTEYTATFKKEKEAIEEATKLSERSLQRHLRNTENTVVWGPSP